MDITKTLWRPEDLGKPIGGSQHAISACLPTWADVVGYEEGENRVIGALQCGYPRFFIHPAVETLIQFLLKEKNLVNQCGLIFHSSKAAERALGYLNDISNQKSNVYKFSRPSVNCFLVTVPKIFEKQARFYWRLSGEGVSSRLADYFLKSLQLQNVPTSSIDTSKTIDAIKEKLGVAYNIPNEDIYLFPSGMAAIFNLHESIRRLKPNHQQVQIGFPYVDTWKTLQTFGSSQSIEISMDSQRVKDFLQKEFQRKPISSIYCECPSNPLLETPDPELLSEISQQMNSFLIIDDTIASSINIDPSPYADVITTSLSKWFNGFGDLLAGSLMLNPKGKNYNILKKALDSHYSLDVFWQDLEILNKHSNDYAIRVKEAGKNAYHLVEWLNASPYTEKVFYCSKEKDPNYAKIARPNSVNPALISVVFDEKLVDPKVMYDHLEISKGPSLGTSWSLVCPYTILAHYDELELVEQYGVAQNLIRISCGAEKEGEIIRKFDSAINKALRR